MQKSSLMNFIGRYKNSKLNSSTLKKLFDKNVDKEDFNGNKIEVWNWFVTIRNPFKSGGLKEIRSSKAYTK